MPRPRRCRYIGFQPNFDYFAPRMRRCDTEVVLKMEELESIRLKDLLGMDQQDAAKQMGISQPTFHRILKEARRKIAEALTEGKAIRIHGGNYIYERGRGRKRWCGRGLLN